MTKKEFVNAFAEKGELLILTAGLNVGETGSTNMLKVQKTF